MAAKRVIKGAVGSGGGKLWGNQLTQGYKTQLRAANGRFATREQARAIEGQRKAVRDRAIRLKRRNTTLGKADYSRRVATKYINSKLISNKSAVAKLAGVGAVAGVLLALNPSVSVSRKNLSVGIRPSQSLGGNYQGFVSLRAGVENTGDDILDRVANRSKAKVSTQVRKVLGNNAKADAFDAVVLGKKDKETGLSNIGGQQFRVDGSPLNRRIRWQGVAPQKAKAGVPGAPKGKGKTKAKPGSSRTGAASTITGTVKGKPAVQGRAQRRGGAKKKKSKKR